MTFVVGINLAANTSTGGGTAIFFAPKEAPVSIKALNDIAQELDELSDEMPALADLSERIGKATDALESQITRLEQTTQVRQGDNMPRYLHEIQRIVEREIGSTRGYRTPRDEREMQRVYEDYLRYAAPRDAFSVISGV